jgi:CDP-glucose 4,6-dehydratase
MGKWKCPLEAMGLINPEFWHGRRVLITGHTGFKGSWLTLYLKEFGAEVTGLSLKVEPDIFDSQQPLFCELRLSNILGACHHIGDIRAPKRIASVVEASQPEIVIHLAAQPLVRRSYSDPLGTWSTNVQGTLNLLEALRHLQHRCSVVMVTTDKIYANKEWNYGYRENDRIGGHDPYSASKAAAELAIDSWRSSFCGFAAHQTPYLAVGTARAGNVIGGGDWAEDRIVPDAMRALAAGNPILLRNPTATRPWQHVLEPLGGYLRLAEALHTYQKTPTDPSAAELNPFASAFNFGPSLEANRSVRELVEEALQHWSGSWLDQSDPYAPHEAGRLHLQIDKAYHQLGWKPRWDFATTVARTVRWYHAVEEGANPLECCLADLKAYEEQSPDAN